MAATFVITQQTLDRLNRLLDWFEHRPPEPVPTAPPRPDAVRPPVRGILLANLADQGQADCAFSQYSPTSFLQLIEIEGIPTGGTFRLTFSGQTTTPIPWNASNLQVQTALIALPNIGPNDVSVALGKQIYTNNCSNTQTTEFPGVWIVTFQGAFAQGKTPATPPLMTVASSLTGTSNMTVTKTQWADSGIVETANAIIPVGTPSPMVAGAAVGCEFYPGLGWAVIACEGRQFAPGPY